MKDFGIIEKILGMEIRRDNWLSHVKYIQKILENFNMIEAKAVCALLGLQFSFECKVVSHNCSSGKD